MAAAPWATRAFGFRGFVGVYAIAAMLWLFSQWGASALAGAVGPQRRRGRRSSTEIVLVAIVLRLLVAFSDPALSGDVYRYLWDGSVLRSGANPYEVLPRDPRVNHPGIRTIYPPHAELLFAAFPNITSWRLFLIACDVGVIVLLRRNPALALAYATFPPAIFEGTWSGHVEIAAALLLLIAARFDSGSAEGAAIGMKVIPVAALPALIARSSRRWRFAVVAALVVAVPFVPFLMAGDVMPGMRDYATRWIFNSPLFDLVHAAIDRAGVAEALKDLWTAVKDPLGLEAISPFVYRNLYSDFLARAFLAAVAVALIAILVAKRKSVASCVGALLLCSPAIHPWYWLVLVPLALFERARLWLLVALFAPFSYLLYDGIAGWLVALLCYGVPVVIASLRLSGSASSAAAVPSAETPARREPDTSPS